MRINGRAEDGTRAWAAMLNRRDLFRNMENDVPRWGLFGGNGETMLFNDEPILCLGWFETYSPASAFASSST